MKKFILAAVLALPLTALVSQQASASNHCTPLYRVGISLGLVFRGWCGCEPMVCPPKGCHKGKGMPCAGTGCGGPWYNSWPHPAHFQTPAPTGYPWWPAPMTYGGYAAAPQQGMAAPMALAQPTPGLDYYAAPTMTPGQNFGGYRAVQPVGYSIPTYYPGYGQ